MPFDFDETLIEKTEQKGDKERDQSEGEYIGGIIQVDLSVGCTERREQEPQNHVNDQNKIIKSFLV